MKVETVLIMYDALIGGNAIERRSFCGNYEISERTFYRYMREISLFLMKYKKDLVIDVHEPDGVYYLKR